MTRPPGLGGEAVDLVTGLVPNERYHVAWERDGLAGEFLGHFEGYDVDDGTPADVVAIHFVEGLTLTEWAGVEATHEPDGGDVVPTPAGWLR